LFNNGRQETKELAEVQEVMQLCIKPIKTIKITEMYCSVKDNAQLLIRERGQWKNKQLEYLFHLKKKKF